MLIAGQTTKPNIATETRIDFAICSDPYVDRSCPFKPSSIQIQRRLSSSGANTLEFLAGKVTGDNDSEHGALVRL
jgi:hypothetical protein